MVDRKQVLEQLEKRLAGFETDKKYTNVGSVEKNNDGVIQASGLSQAMMGEMVEFENGTEGVVLNLSEDYVSIILLGSGTQIREGDTVKTSGKLLSITNLGS